MRIGVDPSAGEDEVRLDGTCRLATLDEMGVPHRAPSSPPATTWHRLGIPGHAAAVHWYVPPAGAPDQLHRLGRMPVCVPVAPASAVDVLLAELGGTWRLHAPVTGPDGSLVSGVWRADDGSTVVPFDPDAAVAAIRSERYGQFGGGRASGVVPLARAVYYRVRPLMPRPLQIALRRAFTRLQSRSSFPDWPVEPSVHDFCEQLLQWVADAAGEPVPYLAPWPDGHEWALVLTHDVEHAAGRDAIGRVRALERDHGVRSSWNLVPERYAVPDGLVTELSADGCEVGVHGLRHDGRDLASPRVLRRRLPEMRRWADRWGAVGFRAPATHRIWSWMPALGFDYDTSYPDTDPYEPMAGGCCSWLPFFNRGMVELPITLPQDHTLLTILRDQRSVLAAKADVLRERGGMALLIVHPDYMLEDDALALYSTFLEHYAHDPTAWRALPREISEWWRRRAETRLVLTEERWQLRGPGRDRARIVWTTPSPTLNRPIGQLDQAA